MSGKTIRETVGFIGVIASLIFVGLEVRQNTLASRAAAIQEATNVARQQMQMYITNPEVGRIRLTGGENPTRLSTEERATYGWLLASYLWGVQGSYRQWNLGVLPDEEWRAWHRVIRPGMENPGDRTVWSDAANFFPGFLEVVESCDAFHGA
jgi:hypothetical protein